MIDLNRYKSIILQRLTKDELSVYDEDPCWDGIKTAIRYDYVKLIDKIIPRTPKLLQFEFLHWGVTGKLLGEVEVDGVSTIECYVFSGKSIKKFWYDYTEYIFEFFTKGRNEFLRKRLLAPNFWRITPDGRFIKAEELEYILHERQLEYGFRSDPLPETNPYVCTFDLIAEKKKYEDTYRMMVDEQMKSAEYHESIEDMIKRRKEFEKQYNELYYNID